MNYTFKEINPATTIPAGNAAYGTPIIINPCTESCTCKVRYRNDRYWCTLCNRLIADIAEKNLKEEQILPTNVGPTGPTKANSPTGSNYPVEKAKVHPESHPTCNLPIGVNEKETEVQHLNQNHLILGDWKGFVGNTLIKIRFEFTNQTNKLLAWYTILTMDAMQPTGYFEGTETISTKVRFNYLTNDLLIEDLTCGPICGWVTPTSIIGNTPNGNVLLKR